MSDYERRDVKRMMESMSVGELHELLVERDRLQARVEELERENEMLRGDAALMKFCALMRMDPVRPDVHAAACRERDRLRAELERLNRYIVTHDEEYITMKDVLRAEHQECPRLRADLAAALKAKEEARSEVIGFYLERVGALTNALGEACGLVDALLVGKVGSQPNAMREQARALRKVGTRD